MQSPEPVFLAISNSHTPTCLIQSSRQTSYRVLQLVPRREYDSNLRIKFSRTRIKISCLIFPSKLLLIVMVPLGDRLKNRPVHDGRRTRDLWLKLPLVLSSYTRPPKLLQLHRKVDLTYGPFCKGAMPY